MTQSDPSRLHKAIEERAAWHIARMVGAAGPADPQSAIDDYIGDLVEDAMDPVQEDAFEHFGGLGWPAAAIGDALAAIASNRRRITAIAHAYRVLDEECLNPTMPGGHVTP